jgi:hypothetical protein
VPGDEFGAPSRNPHRWDDVDLKHGKLATCASTSSGTAQTDTHGDSRPSGRAFVKANVPDTLLANPVLRKTIGNEKVIGLNGWTTNTNAMIWLRRKSK